YKFLSLKIPFKKPKKSKKNPYPSLTLEQKNYNKSISKKRVFVENAIAGIKRYHILINKYRGKSKEKFDESIELCAGLWNFKIDFKKKITC
ncbi:transposase family protein, partial [Runella zeae]